MTDFNSQEPAKWGELISHIRTLDSVAINKNALTVGRSQNCDIVLTESNFGVIYNVLNGVSKEHFTISRKPGTTFVYLKDTSKNGTYVNGIRIKKSVNTYINSGDQISVGQKSPVVYSFQSLMEEELPETLSLRSTYDNTPQEVPELSVWGRLLSCLLHLKSYDIHKNTFTVGRSDTCDVSIEKTDLSKKHKCIFSREHFVIYKDFDNHIAYIKDLSKTGTYLNNRLIGRGKIQILQHDDRISIGVRLQVFIYKCMYYVHDTFFLPPELKGVYEPSSLLGKGGSGEVRLAYEKISCKMVAIKKIMKAASTTSQKYNLNHPSKIHTEISILKTLKYPFIIGMKNIVDTPTEVFIVLDYMRGGELTNRILSVQPMTESNVKFFFLQIVLAVNYLHSNGITHRDLKPENVLLESDDIETLLKVSDFGLSKIKNMMTTVCGTMSYIAPEILDGRIREYNKQVDVWSLGVILFYMLGKRLPFKLAERHLMEPLILTGQYSMEDDNWTVVSSSAKDLVQRMLTVNPEKRITVTNILKHSWISGDIAVQQKVRAFYNPQIVSSEEENYSSEPPTKRNKLSSSEESTSSN